MIRPPYIEIVRQVLFESKRWGSYTRGEQPLPETTIPDIYATAAVGFYYIGDYERALAVSYKASILHEQKAGQYKNGPGLLYDLFFAALFRGLSNRDSEAMVLWRQLIDKRRNVSAETLRKRRLVNAFVWEAYALLHLERHAEVAPIAGLGYQELLQGYGIDSDPDRNSLEFTLVPLINVLAAYQQEPTLIQQQQAQYALGYYKEQNLKHGRLGYRVIFDLQRLFPTILAPVLPNSDPDQD